MAQTLRELELKEKEREERRRKKEEEKRKRITKPTITKKWKGKDWFAILAPEMFNQVFVSETPATDPNFLIGRNVEVNVGEFLKNPKKEYMKLKFRIENISGKNALTRFNGFLCTREYLYRIVRKRSQKVEIIDYFFTKDGWKLQITTWVILNRNTQTTIQRKVRHKTISILKGIAEKSTINDFVKKVVDGVVQKEIRTACNKIYPVRYSEIAKIEVIKTG